MTLHDFFEQGGDRGEKNSLLAGGRKAFNPANLREIQAAPRARRSNASRNVS